MAHAVRPRDARAALQETGPAPSKPSRMVAVTSPPFGRRRRSPVWGLVLAVALVVALIALAWTFVAADGLQPAARTPSACEALWREGRYTSDLARADHDAFITACLAP